MRSDTNNRYYSIGNGTSFNSFESASESLISGRMRLRQNNTTFTVADGSAANDLVVSALIERQDSAANIIKDGAGKMVLTGENTYTGSTTIDGGILSIGDGGTTGSVAGGIINNAALEVYRKNTITLANNISGAGTLTLKGDGTSDSQVNVTGDNSAYTGNITIDGARAAINMSGGDRVGSGSITVADTGQLWVTGGIISNNVFLNGKGTTEGAGQLGAVRFDGGTTLSGNVTLQSDSRLTTWTGAQATVTGVISGPGGLEKTGTGTLTLTRANTYSGTTTIAGGRLKVNSGLRNTAGIVVSSGATLETGATNMFTANHGAAMADSKVVTVNGGTWVMNSSMDSRIGNVTLNDGATWTSNRGLGNYDVLLANTSSGAATVTVGGAGASTMNGSGGIHLQGVQNFKIADVTGDAGADLTVDMVLGGQGSAGGAAGGINKTGAGTMVLNGTNTYTGKTTVAEGTLAIGATASIAISSEIEVKSGAFFDVSAQTGLNTVVNGAVTSGGFVLGDGQTLTGTGTILGPIQLADGAVIAPGNSPGTQTYTSDLIMGFGSGLDFELNGLSQDVGGGFNDLITVAGNLTLDGTLDVTYWLNDFSLTDFEDYWTIITYEGTLTDNGLELGTMPTLPGNLFFTIDTSNPREVRLVAVPEPSSAVLLALGGLALVFRRRRG